MSSILQAVLWVIAIATVGLLVWGFIRSRNLGFLVLLVGAPGWALLQQLTSPFVTRQIDRVRLGETPAFPFSFLGPTSTGEFIGTYLLAMRLGQALLILLGILLLVLGSKTRQVPSNRAGYEIQPDNEAQAPA